MDGVNDAYELVDIEGFVWSSSCVASELIICEGSLFVSATDFVAINGVFVCCWLFEGRAWSVGKCWGVLAGTGGGDESSFAVLGVFDADLKSFATVLNIGKEKNEELVK